MYKPLILAATAALTLSASSWAAKPGADTTLSIAVSPTTVKFGVPSTVAGAVSTKQAGVSVVLEYDAYPFDGKYTDTGTATTAADGTFSFTVTPPTSTRYRVSTVDKPTVRSNEATLAVRWNIGLGVSDRTPKKGTRVRFSGAVKPALPNGIVYLQHKTAAGWKNVKQIRMVTGTTEQSTYSTRLRIRHTGRYRAVTLGDGAHDTGISPARRIVVH